MLKAFDLLCVCEDCQKIPPKERLQPCPKLLSILEEIEIEILDFFEFKMEITSACRCKKHNAAIGGANDSQHIYGRAADIRANTPEMRYAVLDSLVRHCAPFIEVCPEHIHMDLRDGPFRLILGKDK